MQNDKMQTPYKHLPHLLQHLNKECIDQPEETAAYLQTLKLANLGQLMGGITHTFNNILGGILGYSQLLKEHLADDLDASRQAAVIEQASKRASKLISQLQFYSQKHTGSHRIVDPKMIVEEIRAIAAASFNKNITIKTSYEHGDVRISVDMAAIMHALMNLCINAKEAMPDGGELHLATVLAEKATIFDSETIDSETDTFVTFKIQDTGIGMAAHELQHAMQPLYSTKDGNLALGMGLPTARSIIQDHRGDLRIQSEKGRGTTCWVYLPTTASSSGPRRATEVVESQGKNNGHVIMVVDDESELCLMAKKIFENHGYRVVTADSGRDAIRILETRPDEIQLVILDMCLPGEDGAKVFEAVKRVSAQSKVLLTSGYTYNSPYQDVIDRNDGFFVPKPWDIPELIKKTQQVLAR